MTRFSLLKTGALLGLASCFLLIWQSRSTMPVQPSKPEVPPPPHPSSFHKTAPSFVTPDRAQAAIAGSLRGMLAHAIAELEANTNAGAFEYKASRFQEIIDDLSTNDFATAFGILVELQHLNPTDADRELQLRLMLRWAQTDINAAAAALPGMRTEDRTEACERLAEVFARQNFDRAVSWAQQLPQDSDRQNALIAIAYEAASENPSEALKLASQIPLPPEKRDILTQAASAWGDADPLAAAAWAGQIQDPTLHDQILAAIAISWADKDPINSAQLVLDSIPAGQTQNNAIIGIMQRLAFKDEQAANAWADRFPDELQKTALAELNRISERRRLLDSDK